MLFGLLEDSTKSYAYAIKRQWRLYAESTRIMLGPCIYVFCEYTCWRPFAFYSDSIIAGCGIHADYIKRPSDWMMWFGCGLDVEWRRLGCGLDVDWMWIGCGFGSGFDSDCIRIGCGLDVDWVWLGC